MKGFPSKKEELHTLERLRSLVTDDPVAVDILVQYGDLHAKIRSLDAARRRNYKKFGGRKVNAMENLNEVRRDKSFVRAAIMELLRRGKCHCDKLDQAKEVLKCDSELLDRFLSSAKFPKTLPVLVLTGLYWRLALGIPQ